MYQATAPATLPESPLDSLEDLSSDLAITAANDFSLDDLLAESMTEKRKADEVKAGRVAIAKGGISKADSDAIQASIRSWEAKREWIPKAAVVMFSRQQCLSCGSYHTQFLGWYQRQQHRSSSIQRWIASIKPTDSKLLRESKYKDSHTEMCEDCAEAIGFEVEE